MSEVKVLTSTEGLRTNTAPNGRMFKIVNCKVYPGLCKVAYGDDKKGELPGELNDVRYTGQRHAQDAITQYLKKFWDMSDRETNKKIKA